MANLFIGLMSGTSLDGVDAVLADFEGQAPQVITHASAPLPIDLRSELLELNSPGNNELHRAALAGNQLVRIYAQLVAELLQKADISSQGIRAIGAHGQTVRHRPREFDGTGYTLQLNQPALLAELCGIDVVADFRSRDVAAGGQGAPLVPPFHQRVFGRPGQSIAVMNVGGISNVTILAASPGVPLIGFDCGPGNTLMDAWCLAHTGTPFDDAGRWAAGGTVQQEFLASMLAEPFFAKIPPKSTGRDLFNAPWLSKHMAAFGALAAQDVQATLAELTAVSCGRETLAAMPECQTLVVCALGKHRLRAGQRAADQQN